MQKIVIACALLCALPAFAATPAAGTLSLEELELEYTSDLHVNANIIHQSDNAANGPTCLPPVLACEDFALTLDFPEDIVSIYPSAVVRISWFWDDPSGAGVVDFDCWIYDGAGNLLDTSGASASNPEAAAFLLNGGVNDYILRCVPFLAVGNTYTGRAEVFLGEPVEGARDGGDSGFVGVLLPAEKTGDKQANALGNTGAGAMLWFLPLLGLLAGFRRR